MNTFRRLDYLLWGGVMMIGLDSLRFRRRPGSRIEDILGLAFFCEMTVLRPIAALTNQLD